jgi:hypothetical protein
MDEYYDWMDVDTTTYIYIYIYIYTYTHIQLFTQQWMTLYACMVHDATSMDEASPIYRYTDIHCIL